MTKFEIIIRTGTVRARGHPGLEIYYGKRGREITRDLRYESQYLYSTVVLSTEGQSAPSAVPWLPVTELIFICQAAIRIGIKGDLKSVLEVARDWKAKGFMSSVDESHHAVFSLLSLSSLSGKCWISQHGGGYKSTHIIKKGEDSRRMFLKKEGDSLTTKTSSFGIIGFLRERKITSYY